VKPQKREGLIRQPKKGGRVRERGAAGGMRGGGKGLTVECEDETDDFNHQVDLEDKNPTGAFGGGGERGHGGQGYWGIDHLQDKGTGCYSGRKRRGHRRGSIGVRHIIKKRGWGCGKKKKKD